MAFMHPQTGGAQIIGLDELDFALSRLSGSLGSRVMRSGLSAAATPIKRVVRALVKTAPVGTEHEASVRAGVRKTVGHSIKKDMVHGYTLKVGFGVGKKGARRDTRTSKGTTAGKGISPRNVHWFVLGTDKMAAFFQGILRDAAMDAQPTAVAKLRSKVRERLAIEAQRARRRGGK